MNQAEHLSAALALNIKDFADLMIEADERGEAIEKDYENQHTFFEMPDGSVALFNGMDEQILAYGAKS